MSARLTPTNIMLCQLCHEDLTRHVSNVALTLKPDADMLVDTLQNDLKVGGARAWSAVLACAWVLSTAIISNADNTYAAGG